MFHSPPLQHRSISKDLTRILILILVVIACIAFFLSYLVSTWRAKRTLEMKADEYIASLTEILSIPLWTLDRDTITVIGKTYMQSEFVSTLTITSENISLSLSAEERYAHAEITRSGKVFYSGELLGSVSISLTSDYYTILHRQLFLSYSITILIMLVLMFFLTEGLLGQCLKKPFLQFIDLVNAYAGGHHEAFTQQIPYREFQPLITVLK